MNRLRSRKGQLVVAALLALGLASAASKEPRAAPATACEPESIGIDTSLANGVDGVFFGRAFAQVFLAEDSLLSSVTVWRPAGEGAFPTPVRLFIIEADSATLRPRPAAILFTGDTLSAPQASDDPIPLRWEFDPPFALPRRGHYAFAVKEDDPSCSGIFSFLIDTLSTYSEGDAWRVAPTILCTMSSAVSRRPWDLVFWLEFCRPPVAVKEQSWGRIKAIYR